MFSGDPVSEDDDLTLAEGIPHGGCGVEVTLRAGSHGASVDGRELGAQISLVADDGQLRCTGQLCHKVAYKQLHPARCKGGHWLAVKVNGVGDAARVCQCEGTTGGEHPTLQVRLVAFVHICQQWCVAAHRGAAFLAEPLHFDSGLTELSDKPKWEVVSVRRELVHHSLQPGDGTLPPNEVVHLVRGIHGLLNRADSLVLLIELVSQHPIRLRQAPDVLFGSAHLCARGCSQLRVGVPQTSCPLAGHPT